MRADNTFALIVGIEEYAAGNSWDLKGPAKDACRFANWLHSKGVPKENMAVFISSADNSSLDLPDGLTPKPATIDNIHNSITKDLQARDEGLFYLFWGGHGIITLNEDRHLLGADATEDDKRSLNLNALIAFLRTNYFDKTNALSKQVFIVDACANHTSWHKDLPERTFPNGDPLDQGREQYVLLAASPSEYATNLDDEQTGLFTRELMSLLETQEDLLPDYSKLTEELMKTFDRLRNEEKTEQTPAYLWHRDWKGSAGNIGSFKGEEPPAREVKKELTLDRVQVLINAVYKCGVMKTRDSRDAVLDNLIRESIRGAINRNNNDLIDVHNIVRRCLSYQGAVIELVEAIKFFERDSIEVQTLEKLIKQLNLR